MPVTSLVRARSELTSEWEFTKRIVLGDTRSLAIYLELELETFASYTSQQDPGAMEMKVEFCPRLSSRSDLGGKIPWYQEVSDFETLDEVKLTPVVRRLVEPGRFCRVFPDISAEYGRLAFRFTSPKRKAWLRVDVTCYSLRTVSVTY